jgi:hypothetical protein
MVMTLRDGTPSVPSSAIGKLAVSPATASILVEVVRTADGAAVCGSGVRAAGDGWVSLVEPSHRATRMRLGTSAARMSPAISK